MNTIPTLSVVAKAFAVLLREEQRSIEHKTELAEPNVTAPSDAKELFVDLFCARLDGGIDALRARYLEPAAAALADKIKDKQIKTVFIQSPNECDDIESDQVVLGASGIAVMAVKKGSEEGIRFSVLGSVN